MGWLSLAIGLAGVGVAALTIVLGYRERTAGLRNVLYQGQLEAYEELVGAAGELIGLAINFVTIHGIRGLDEDHRIELRQHAAQLQRDMGRVRIRRSVLLPASVLECADAVNLAFTSISAPSEVLDHYPSEIVHSGDPGLALSEAFNDLVGEIRHQLGIVPLGAQTNRLFGVDRERTAASPDR